MITRSEIALALFLVATPAHAVIECHPAPGHDGAYWSWREIDGRRCWYRGIRGMPKDHLRWPAPGELKKSAPTVSDKDSVWPPLSDADREKYMLESIWPELAPDERPRASFDDRFGGIR